MHFGRLTFSNCEPLVLITCWSAVLLRTGMLREYFSVSHARGLVPEALSQVLGDSFLSFDLEKKENREIERKVRRQVKRKWARDRKRHKEEEKEKDRNRERESQRHKKQGR